MTNKEKFTTRYGKIEEPEKLREEAEKSLKLIQELVREKLKKGGKPKIPKDITSRIKKVVENVLNQPEKMF